VSRRTTTAGLGLLALLITACGPDGTTPLDPSPDVTAKRGGPPPPPPPPPPADVCDYDDTVEDMVELGWTNVFADEFTGSALTADWASWTGGAFNEELQHYQASNVSVSNGTLSIAARRETVTGQTHPWDETLTTFDFTSGRIESVQHFSASDATPVVRLSARIKLPAGYGLWPAFWSYGDPWPTQGEIDILEARGQDPTQYQTAFWYGRREGVNQVRNSAAVITTATSLTACWHVYEVEWARGSLTYYLDGNVVDVKTDREIRNMYGKRQRITLNLAVGGLFFSNLDPAQIEEGTLQVDWVRAWVGP